MNDHETPGNSHYLNLCVFLLAVFSFACDPGTKSASGPYQQKIDSLLSEMSIDEKAGQLTLYTGGYAMTGADFKDDFMTELRAGRAGNMLNAFSVEYARKIQRAAVSESRLGIPMLFGLDVIHGFKTTYPTPLAESCTWDLDIIEKTARLSAKEATAGGVNWTFNPMVDIARDPRWGRIAEGAGEDPYLGSLVAAARVRGYQGTDLSSKETMLACVKHFAGYGKSKAGRDYHTVDMSDRELRQNHLPPFKAAIDAGAGSVMSGFHEFNGIPATGNRYLLTEILREEWDFRGFVVSDYTSINEMINHGIVADGKEAAKLAFEAGVDMDMQGGLYSEFLPQLVKEGEISEDQLDARVRNVLRIKYELGLFEDPFRYLDSVRERETYYSQEFFDHALHSARESIVLLKNKDNTLPLSKETKSVALIGPLADDPKAMLGAWYVAGDADKVITVRQALANMMPDLQVNHAKGTGYFDASDRSGFAEALAIAKKSEVIIMTLGETHSQSGESTSRTSLDFPANQLELLQEIHQLGKPIVLVAMAGRPLTLEWSSKNIPAILNTWHLGARSGPAIVETLFGDNNPSGKLTTTFPRNIGQIPVHYSMKNTGRPYEEGNFFTTKYLDSPNEPLYPFGYGLSYTEFEYSGISLSASQMTRADTIFARVTVDNKGQREGEEIVQLYVRDLVGSLTRPVKELKGFRKIKLDPGQSTTVEFAIDNEMLKFYTASGAWKSEPGSFKLFVGTNSVDVKEVKFELIEGNENE